jgi:hypothetical protein
MHTKDRSRFRRTDFWHEKGWVIAGTMRKEPWLSFP